MKVPIEVIDTAGGKSYGVITDIDPHKGITINPQIKECGNRSCNNYTSIKANGCLWLSLVVS